jgi:diadenosine tetraphosphate (Ap4A) HIT family hydrolase
MLISNTDMRTDKKHLNLDNARRDDQRELMRKIIEDGICPFCRENLEKYHPKPILFETDCWIVTTNAFPYELTKGHFLVIYRDHIENNSQISPKGWQEIEIVIARLQKEHGLEYGTMLMRFGDTSKTGATVTHLHFQLVQSDPESPDYDPKKGLMTRIG